MNRYLPMLCLFFTALALPFSARAIDPGSSHGSQWKKKQFPLDLRLSVGKAFRLGGERREGLALDFVALGRFELNRSGTGILAEAGCSTFIGNDYEEHNAIFGLGYGFMGKWHTIGIVSSLVFVNSEEYGTDSGYRTTILVELPHFIGVQAAHQISKTGRFLSNEFRFTVSLHIYGILSLL